MVGAVGKNEKVGRKVCFLETIQEVFPAEILIKWHYFERKMQEFFDLKMGNMTMEEYVKKFLDLLRYVDCLKDEKIKI